MENAWDLATDGIQQFHYWAYTERSWNGNVEQTAALSCLLKLHSHHLSMHEQRKGFISQLLHFVSTLNQHQVDCRHLTLAGAVARLLCHGFGGQMRRWLCTMNLNQRNKFPRPLSFWNVVTWGSFLKATFFTLQFWGCKGQSLAGYCDVLRPFFYCPVLSPLQSTTLLGLPFQPNLKCFKSFCGVFCSWFST